MAVHNNLLRKCLTLASSDVLHIMIMFERHSKGLASLFTYQGCNAFTSWWRTIVCVFQPPGGYESTYELGGGWERVGMDGCDNTTIQ